MELEDRLWTQLEAAAGREARRGRFSRTVAEGRARLRARRVPPAAAVLVGAALAMALVVGLHSDPSAPEWRVERVGISRAELNVGTGGFGSVWTYDRSSGEVLRVDPRSHAVVARVGIPGTPGDVAVAAGPDAVWAVQTFPVAHDPAPAPAVAATLFRIDPRSNRVTGRVPLRAPDGTTVRPIGLVTLPGAVWVWGETGALRVDPARDQVVAAVSVPEQRLENFAVDATHVWAATDDQRLVGFDARTGARTGAILVRHARVRENVKLVEVGEGIVVGRQDGSLANLDPRTGRVLWAARLGLAPSDLALSGGRLWVLLADPAAPADQLLALDPDTGRTVMRISLGTDDGRALVAAGPVPYVITSDALLVPRPR
jgi:hypothetical protein